MIKIDNEKQLLAFLRQITKSTLKESNVLEKDPYIKDFEIKNQQNKKMFEQEEEEADNEEDEKDVEGEAEEADNEEDEAEEDDLTPAAKKALSLPDYEEGKEISFEQIISAINLVRAGNSTNSKQTREEVKDYFERLDEEEKAVLLIYLKELAKIMTGAIDADDALDPSDPPKSQFDIIVKKEKEEKEKTDTAPSTKKSVKSIKPDQSSLEDTTPPIKVNESQDKTLIKRKVQILMNS